MKVKLIDKEGYINSHYFNAVLVKKYFDSDYVLDVVYREDCGLIGHQCVIEYDEWKYFERLEK